jgi:hypothetical protein
MIRWSGSGSDWARLIRWGSPMHGKWACRDEAACQERKSGEKKDRRLILERHAFGRCRDVLTWPPGWWITAG